MRKRFVFLIVPSLTLVFLTGSANAAAATGGAVKAWVSNHGADIPGCGPVSGPCRTFQYVHDHIVGSGGSIFVLDPGGYGPINITMSLSIINDGVGVAAIAPGYGTAVNIAAPSDAKVMLKGLTIDGEGSGGTGVYLGTAAALTISNCAVRGFTSTGIALGPTTVAKVAINDTLVSDNSGDGIYFQPTAGGSDIFIDRVEVFNNTQSGIAILGNLLSSPFAFATATITNTSASHNGSGFYGFGGNATAVLTIVRSTASGNGQDAQNGGFAGFHYYQTLIGSTWNP